MARYDRLTTIVNTPVPHIESNFIYYAENELDGRLSPVFTVPFSSNNVTATDLSIDMTFCRAGNLKAEERKEVCDAIDMRIKRLIDGLDDMLLADGTVLATVGGTVYSTTMNYHPVFGMGNIVDMVVDSSQVQAEEDAR